MEKKYLLKLSKVQDLRNEIYIPKIYTGESDKFFKDPRIEDPNPLGEAPHNVKIQMKWKGYDIDYKDYELKNFRNEFDANNDTRIAGTPKKELNSIMLFIKNDDEKYDAEIINKDSDRYENMFKTLDGKSYLIIDDIEKITNMQGSDSKYPLNQILYGPPGTGKTYSTVTKSLVILGLIEEKDKYSEEEYERALVVFQNELGKRIQFVTMHQSYSYEDFVQGLKPDKTEDGQGIVFDYKDGVFMNICNDADENRILVKSGNKSVIETDRLFPSFMLSIDEETVSSTLQEHVFHGASVNQTRAIEYFNEKLGKKYCKAWRDKFDYILEEESPRKGYQPDKFREGELENFHEYADLFKMLSKSQRIKKIIDQWINNDSSKKVHTEATNNYVIILDEINRCNVSKVFGELITMIEDDKRDLFKTTLPSGDPFSVPKNLYIIGTMNTADKSISMVDIALRRRFEFVAMYPNPDLVVNKEKKNFMKSINKIIRDRKSIDFEIGHSDFMKNLSFQDTLNHKTIPLLVEYFRNDMNLVLEMLSSCIGPANTVKIDQQWFDKTGLIRVGSRS